MEFQNLIEKRRSVRKYVERNTVTKDEILSMIKAAQEAPSWKNSQTGRYYCIMDEKCGTVQTGMSAGNECREM